LLWLLSNPNQRKDISLHDRCDSKANDYFTSSPQSSRCVLKNVDNIELVFIQSIIVDKHHASIVDSFSKLLKECQNLDLKTLKVKLDVNDSVTPTFVPLPNSLFDILPYFEQSELDFKITQDYQLKEDDFDWFDRLFEEKTFDFIKISLSENYFQCNVFNLLREHIDSIHIDKDYLIGIAKQYVSGLQTECGEWYSRIKHCTKEKMKQNGMKEISIEYTSNLDLEEYICNLPSQTPFIY